MELVIPAFEEETPATRAVDAEIAGFHEGTIAAANEANSELRIRSVPRFFVARISVGFAEEKGETERTRRCSGAGESRRRLGRRVP